MVVILDNHIRILSYGKSVGLAVSLLCSCRESDPQAGPDLSPCVTWRGALCSVRFARRSAKVCLVVFKDEIKQRCSRGCESCCFPQSVVRGVSK